MLAALEAFRAAEHPYVSTEGMAFVRKISIHVGRIEHFPRNLEVSAFRLFLFCRMGF